MRLLLLVICLFAVMGCDESPTGPGVPLRQRFTLAPGDVARIDDTALRVQFLSVSGDSRCPADAVCITGGDATVHVRAIESGSPAEYELHTGDASRARATHRRFVITLEELQPYPFSSRTIAPGEYRATFSVAES